MMNRMMKTKAAFTAQAADEACVILHAAKDKFGGLINRDWISSRL